MFWINGVLIPAPSDWEIDIAQIENSAITASGLKVVDVIATKSTLNLSYAILSDAQLSALRTRLYGQTFNTVRFPDPPIEKELIMKTESLNYTGWRPINGIRHYINIRIVMRER